MSTPALTGAPAGSRRFWVTVLCFAIANAAMWGVYHRFVSSRHPGLLSVDRFEPRAGATVGPRPTFTWHFNLDVMPPLPDAPPVGVVSPAVGGKWKFTDPRTLCFTPDADLPHATRFTFTLPAERLRTVQGFQLDKTFTAAVETTPLALTAMRQASFSSDNRMVIELEFNDRVLPADVIRRLAIRSMDSKEIRFELHGDAVGKTIRVMTDPIPLPDERPEHLHVVVTLKAGLAGMSGPLAMADPIERPLEVSAELMATHARPRTPADGDARIDLSFNNNCDADALHEVISVEPAVPFRLTTSGSRAELIGAFQPGTRYAVKIAGAAAVQRPKNWTAGRCYPKPDTFSVLMPDRDARIWFERDEGYLGSRGNRTLLAHAVNQWDLKVTVWRVYDNNLVAWRNARDSSDPSGYSQPMAVKRIRLPQVKNKMQDIRLAIDDLLPAGQERDGVYRVSINSESPTAEMTSARLGSDEGDEEPIDFSDRYANSATVVTLSDLGVTAKQSHDGVVAWVVSLSTGKPVAQARVRLYSNKNQQLGEAVSDADGIARIGPVHPAPGEQPTVLLADRLGNSKPEARSSKEVRNPNFEVDSSFGIRASSVPASKPSPLGTGEKGPESLTWLDLRSSEVSLGDADVTGRQYLRKGFEAFVYTDRGVYRPGEKVHLRAVVRGRDNATPPVFPVKWRLRRPDLRDWKSQVVQLDPDGAAGLELDLPADLSTGRWTADIGLPGEKDSLSTSFGSVTFQVEEFVPNRMKVALDIAGGKGKPGAENRLSLLDGPLVATVQADYLFGRPVTERPATLVARAEPTSFGPKQWEGWTFGDAAQTSEALGAKRAEGARLELPEAALNARGTAHWELAATELFENVKPKRQRDRNNESDTSPSTAYTGPWRVSLSASVIETGGRAVSAGRTVDVDCVPYYVALRLPANAAAPRTPYAAELALVTPTGEPATRAARLEVEFYRENWNNSLVNSNGRYHYEATRRLERMTPKQLVSLTDGRGTFTVTPPVGGSYVLRVSDPATGFVTSRGFIASEGAWDDNISRADPEKLDVIVLPLPRFDVAATWEAARRFDGAALLAAGRRAIAFPNKSAQDAPAFHVGDEAQLIIRSPFAGQLLLTVETDSVLSTRVITMPASHMAVPVRIDGACRPNAYVAATVIRAIDPGAKWATHRAFGVARLNVDNSDRRLKIDLAAPAEVRPSRSLGIDVRLTDEAGRPAANTAVTVAAVDEGICALTSFSTPDPYAFFTSRRALGVKWADFYDQLMPEIARPDKQSAVGGDGGTDADDARHASPVSARRVRPVSLFAGVLHTDANGVAHADFNVPEFSGQLRIMTVGYGAKLFGSAAKPVLVRSPLLVQSSWPRFAAPGDSFNVPLIVFNNSKAAGTVQLSVDLLDDGSTPCPLAFRGQAPRTFQLPAMTIKPGGQAEIAFEMIATQSAGVGRVRLRGSMGDETFEENIEMPIRPASPTISTGGYATATPQSPCKLTVPGGMLEGTGEFQVQVSPKPVLELPRGLDYLEHYPYGCAEQTASACFPLVYLSDIGKEIAPGVFEQGRVTEKVNAGILRLIGMQTADGGISMWPGERKAWPWGSVYAAHFLVEARATGYDVPQEFYDGLLAYVRNELSYSGDEAEAIEGHCYACYVLALAGKPERAVMSHLAELLTAPPPAYPPNGWRPYSADARFNLAAAWLAAGRRDLAASLIPHTLPQPRRDRAMTGNVGSPIRDRAVLVNTLLAVQPDHPELPGLVQQLSDAGRKGQWCSTQDTAFAVMALGRYLRQTRAEQPFDAAELSITGTRIAASENGKPLTWLATSHSDSPAALPAGGAEIGVRITGVAGAKAHVAWLYTGVPLQPPPDADSGMKIRRRYLDSHGQPLVGNSVRSGDLVQIELTVQADSALENIVIDDLLPAGLEIENPRLETAASDAAVERKPKPNEIAFQATRREVRDDRLVLMGRLSMSGSGTYCYTARAVTPGTFVVPPVRGECMYDIGTNSLSGGGKVLRVLSIEKASIANTAE